MPGVLTEQLGDGDGVCGDGSLPGGGVERLRRLENVGVSCANVSDTRRHAGRGHLSAPGASAPRR